MRSPWQDPAGDRTGDGAGDGPSLTFFGAMREAVAGGTAFGVRKTAPPGRAERLGLAEISPAASTSLTLPLEFLQLGDDPRIKGELAGVVNGLGARVFEFSADERPGAGGDSSSGWSIFPYHVAVVELGFALPWFAIAVRRMHSPSQQIYGGRRGSDLQTADRRVNRGYVLHASDPAAVAAVLDAPMRDWLVSVLALRIEHRPLITIEVNGGCALAAIQATGLTMPDALALKMADRPKHSGPWPDTLLAILAGFRDRIPPACRG